VTREALEAQLLRLPPDERAHLARVLIESLDEALPLDAEWLEEARRRAAELDAGLVTPVPAGDVLGTARRRLGG
jgi:putative addiction module component (TIGR02574 family)